MVEATGELNPYSVLEVPIAKVGAWAHPAYGTISFTEEDFDAAITNFNSGALGFEPHLSFGHLDEEPNSTDSARKRGTLKHLVKDGDKLNGYFKVPKGTAEAVANGEFEYSSGEFIRNLMDKDSGKYRGLAISRVALTNTPYLPWGEAGKVQLLSHTGGNISLDIISSVIKLSHANTPPNQVPVVEGMNNMTVENITPTVAVPPDLSPVVASMSVAAPAPVVDVDAIANTIMARMKEEQDKVRAAQEAEAKRIQDEKDAAASAMIRSLESKMSEMADRLAKAETEASLFGRHASRAEQAVEMQQLMSMGASATLVNKYSAIKGALESKSSTVKLSQGGTERESTLLDSIKELLIDALQQVPVVTTQMGLSGVPTESEGGVKGFLERVALENRKKATPVAI